MVHDRDYHKKLTIIVKNALEEDIQDGDHSSLSCIGETARGRAVLKIKNEGILAGVEVAKWIFLYVDPTSHFRVLKNDGEKMYFGESAFEVESKVYTILTCERLVLNCMQRMSGIATLTKQYTDKLAGYSTKLLDTRKTTPNFRLLEKEAVYIGGGVNHRFGLYDMIMLKDNHIDYCGGINKALNKAYDYVKEFKPGMKIEIETRNIADVKKVVESGKADRIMLDNFTPEKIKEALIIINGQFITEASGGITLENIESYAATGVDFISSGAIIHQAKSLDLSLKAQLK
jgi:nicotinate-nucleotide pyrophosphorylase (carboxylating)